MPWHYLNEASEPCIYSPEPVAGSLPTSSSGTFPFALWSLTPIAEVSCSPDNRTESCQDSQSGMTCGPLTGDHGGDLRMLLPEAGPAKDSASREKDSDSTTPDPDYGPSLPGSFAKWHPDSCSWKTRQLSFTEGLAEFSETWPKWGTMRDGECWVSETPEGCMNEIGSGLLAIPTIGKNETKGASVKRFRGSPHFRGAKMSEGLRTSITDPSYTTPAFAEAMMDFPMGWTALEPLETRSVQAWLRSHGAS